MCVVCLCVCVRACVCVCVDIHVLKQHRSICDWMSTYRGLESCSNIALEHHLVLLLGFAHHSLFSTHIAESTSVLKPDQNIHMHHFTIWVLLTVNFNLTSCDGSPTARHACVVSAQCILR